MSLLTSWLESPPPDAAIELAPGRVSVAAIDVRGSAVNVLGCAVESLPDGVIVPSLASQNIVDNATVTDALRSALGRLSTRPTRVALVIPDSAAKVSLVHFDRVPSKRDDLDQLVRWQVRKSAPFAIEDACVSYSPGARPAEGGGDFVVVMAKRAVVQEYEQVCAAAGTHAGLVDLPSLSVLNWILTSSRAPAGDWLAVYMRPECTTVAIVRSGHVIFFRNRPEGSEDTLADLVHQTAMYYQDRLEGHGFTRVFLGGRGRTDEALEAARQSLDGRIGVTVELLDASRVASRPSSAQLSVADSDTLAPLLGVLLRSRIIPVAV